MLSRLYVFDVFVFYLRPTITRVSILKKKNYNISTSGRQFALLKHEQFLNFYDKILLGRY